MRKEYKRSLIKFSNYSLCVTLPKTMLNKLGLDKGDEVNITMRRGKIIIEAANLEGQTSANSQTEDDSDDEDDQDWEPLPEVQ